jgi:hypothetical protein
MTRVILAAGMLMLASALARAEEKLPPANDQHQPTTAPTPVPSPATAPAPATVSTCRPVPPPDCFQKFQDWLTFCPERTPCCGHCCGCGCTPACPPLYTYFLDHCGYGFGHGCGCAAVAAPVTPAPTPPVALTPTPCETCRLGFWHRLLGH